MGQRLYNIGLRHEIHWPKTKENNSNSFPIGLQHIESDETRLEKQYRTTRYLSSPNIILTKQGVFRNGNTLSSGLSLHIQSMKKSAFKMLCKLR